MSQMRKTQKTTKTSDSSLQEKTMFGKKDSQPDYEMFAIYDTKVDSYDMPLYGMNQHDIIREITNRFTDQQRNENKYYRNAEDYQLFKIGSYTKKSGALITQNPEHVANLHELKSIAQRSEQGPGVVHST